jgi:glyoxylase-like metal-dependent hydrolase (beta-lactamase superfamily II)
VDAPYARVEELEPGIARVLAHNPSAFTFFGTQSYIVGEREVAVIDPGPDLPEHLDALEKAIGGRRVAAIMCTHTHRDHSPAARPLAGRTGAPVIGCAALALESVGPRADASFDGDYAPDRTLADGEVLAVDGKPVVAVATPGHTSNHLCFAYRGALFSGDHVMGWSTTVVVPPDGDMAAYMASLDKLRARDDRIYYPAHGPAVDNPQQYVRQLIGHRKQRERQILKLVGEQPRGIPDIVANAYPALDPRLIAAAGGSVLAHLLDLQGRGLVQCIGKGDSPSLRGTVPGSEDLWTAA